MQKVDDELNHLSLEIIRNEAARRPNEIANEIKSLTGNKYSDTQIGKVLNIMEITQRTKTATNTNQTQIAPIPTQAVDNAH